MKQAIKEDCLFCKIATKQIPSFKVYENHYVYAFLDVNPNSNGHTLVVPKKHFDNFSTCDEKYVEEVAKAKLKIVQQMKKSLDPQPKGYNYTSNEGIEAYQVVFHYHEHIIPKYVHEEGYVIQNKTNKDSLKPLEEIAEVLEISE